MKINTVMVLTNSADELSDIPLILCENEELKMLPLEQQVAAQNVYNMSETAETCLVVWDHVMDENGIWQCAYSM